MSLFDLDLPAGRPWTRVGDAYEVTKKPRGLDVSLSYGGALCDDGGNASGRRVPPDYDWVSRRTKSGPEPTLNAATF